MPASAIMWTFGPMAPPGMGKFTTRASAARVIGLTSYSSNPSTSAASTSPMRATSKSSAYPVPFSACHIERTSGCEVPDANGRTDRSMPSAPPSMAAM